MTKYCIVDFRMRKVEKEYIKSLGYEIIENDFNLNTYDEISAHADIYYVKVNDTVFCDPKRKLDGFNMVCGTKKAEGNYPTDVPYNTLIVGKKAIHNFKFTDDVLKTYLYKSGFDMIDVKQGYSKCSTAVIDDTTCISSDMEIARELASCGVDVLYVHELDIKLKRRINKIFVDRSKMSFEDSDMPGFIGGAMTRLGDTVILFGDVSRLVNGSKIQKFIQGKGYKFHYFEGLDVVDYGGVIEVKK